MAQTVPEGVVKNGGPKASTNSRMTLDAVRTGKTREALRVVVHGVEKIGKSTWAAGAPAPIFLPLDDGVGDIDAPKFPNCETLDEALAAVRALTDEKHAYQTLIVDPINWLEPKIWEVVCRKNGWKDIEAAGYGKGYVAAVDEWRVLLVALDRLRAKGVNVILIGHTVLAKIGNAQGEDYERNGLAMHKSAAGLFYGWADAVLYAEHEIGAKKDKGATKAKAFDTGVRFFRTAPNAAYFAGNRFSLPDPLPLEASAFWDAVETSRQSAAQWVDKARALALLLGGDAVEKAEAFIKNHSGDARRLIDMCNRIQTAIDTKAEETSK